MMDADLAAWGKVIILETAGRRSGQPRRVAVGYVLEADGSLLVAASDPSAHWARNLAIDPSCVVERDGTRTACLASNLEGAASNAAVAALILKYGTPAERLGSGPTYRLVPRDLHAVGAVG
jgi:deazaflavin-dependent oxidoreductase (nitroreductase family)